MGERRPDYLDQRKRHPVRHHLYKLHDWNIYLQPSRSRDEASVRRLLVLLLFALPSFAATAHVQSCTPTTATATSLAITCNGVGANTVTLGIAIETSGNTVSTVSDGTNTYVKSTSSPCVNGTNNRTYIYSFTYGSAPGNRTITVTPNASSSITIFASEFSGSSGTLDVDGSGTCTGTGTTFNLPTLTPPSSGDFLYAVCSDLTSTVNGKTGSWTNETVTNGDVAQWQVNVGTSAVAVGVTSTASSGWSCMEAAYKASVTVIGDTIAGPTTWGGNNTIK
jgi:hypothetical protein